MILQNLHTHSTYCDGADSPEEIIIKAIEKGFEGIGFSGHSYMNYSPMFDKEDDKTNEYKCEISRLKEKYKDKINVFLGLEVDMYSAPDMTGYDYLIGSVHYLKIDGEYVGFDRDDKAVENVINTYFGGSGIEYAKEYYKELSLLPDYGNFDILGHFDIITKHSDKRDFFDTSSKEYINAALEAADALRGKIPFFEVNTGAISRGYRKSPYPSPLFIKELKGMGYGAVITSDSHNKNTIDCNFSEAAELLKSCGFKEKYILTHNGFRAVSL